MLDFDSMGGVVALLAVVLVFGIPVPNILATALPRALLYWLAVSAAWQQR